MTLEQLPLKGIVAVYPDERGARLALRGLCRVAGRRRWTGEVTALRRAHGGRLRNDTPRPVRTGAGVIAGGAVGVATGLMTGPVGWLALVGAVTGGATTWFRGARVVDASLMDVGERLTPGTSALVAAVEREHASDVERWLAQGGADLITDLLAARTLAELAAKARPPDSVQMGGER